MLGDTGCKIDISPSGEASVVFKNSDGTVSSKRVSLSDLCASLSKGVIKSVETIPRNCRAVAKKDDLKYYLFTYSPAIRDIWIMWSSYLQSEFGPFNECKPTEEEAKRFPSTARNDIRKFTIPYPGLAYIVVTRFNDIGDYILSNAYAFAIKNDTLPIEKIKVFRWPFTNIYSDGRCCLGGNYSSYKTNSIDGIEGFSGLLFAGLGNSDLTNSYLEPRNWDNYAECGHFSVPENGSLGKIWNEHQFISKIHGLQQFPYEYLKPYSDNLYSLFNSL